MYPNYYGQQLNTIIEYQTDISSSLEIANSKLDTLITSCNILIFALVFSITLGICRKLFAVGR